MQKKRSINKMFLTIIGILLAIIFVAPILILVNSSFKTLHLTGGTAASRQNISHFKII